MIENFLAHLAGTTPLQWLIAFAVMAVTDICWAFYVNAAARSPFLASMWAVFLFWMGGIAVIGYTTHPALLIPSAAGAFAGTYLGVVLSRRKGEIA